MAIISSEILHASCVAIEGRAVLIEGRSGAGKSDLALRLIDRGAALVSDDYTVLRRIGKRLIASAPDTIAGKIEVRGLGIVDMPHVTDIPVALLIDLGDKVERMPAAIDLRRIAGIDIPVFPMSGDDLSGAIKAELALKRYGKAAA